MKVLRRNIKTGEIKLKTETPEDPWHLEKIIQPGDALTATTLRRTSIKRGNEIIKGERKPVTLTLGVESVSIEAGQLRAKGKIMKGPEDIDLASYHSITIKPGMEIVIRKEKWRRDWLDRIRKAGTKEPLLFICVLDREGADFASLRSYGVQMHGSIASRKVMGREDDRSGYYSEIAKVLEEARKDHDGIILAGPGFEKENLFNYLKEKRSAVVKDVSVEGSSNTGKTGIYEVIKNSAHRILSQTRVVKETELVERLLEGIGSDGLVAYGADEVRKCVMQGAAETLLVSEEMVPDHQGVMDSVEKMGGKVMIITSSHDAGERFLYLGGIAAMLRYKPASDTG